jgi:hypothetical protein
MSDKVAELSADWRIAQTVLLTAGLRTKRQNIHYALQAGFFHRPP